MPVLHIDDELLDQYALGRLPEERLAGVEEHLLVCHACQSRLQASDEFAMLFRVAAVQPDSRPGRAWRLFWNYPAAFRAAGGTAAAAALVAMLLLLTGPFGKAPTAPAMVLMQSLRGPESSAQMSAGKSALLVFDIVPSAGVSYEARVVNPVGDGILASKAFVKDGHLAVLVDRLRPGSYWVRVYRTDDHEPIAEYGLQAR